MYKHILKIFLLDYEVNQFSIPADQLDYTVSQNNLPQMPTRFYFVFVEEQRLNGNASLNPFVYPPNFITKFTFFANEKKLEIDTDFFNGTFTAAYNALIRALPTMDREFAIEKADMETGRFVLAFDTTAAFDASCEQYVSSKSTQPCTWSVSMQFKPPIGTPSNALNMIAIFEFERTLVVDKEFICVTVLPWLSLELLLTRTK